ncbi:MAG TPA: hypothetical protein VMF08_21220 [Candidatus Sulfotelmatobacter sp.]|nr:hypothetical protein [Candidatus Sulfotelmatobacter sp.]
MNDHELARRLRRFKHHVYYQRRALRIPPFKAQAKRRYWKPSEVRLLGTVTDQELAQKLGRTFFSVRVERIRRGIPAITKPRGLSAKYLKLLGKVPDAALAQMTGRSVLTIASLRRQHTTVRFIGGTIQGPPRAWTAEEIVALKRLTIRDAAAKFKCSKAEVHRARRQFGVAARARPDNWTRDEEALLGTLSDGELALRLKRSVTAVQVRRLTLRIPKPDPRYRAWKPAEEKLLGTVPDSQLAEQLGRSRASVTARRQLFNRKAILPPRPDGWTPEEDRLLGKFTDSEVARKLGRPLGGVRGRRHKLGIKSPRSTRTFTPMEDKLLGTDYDRVIGQRLKRHPVTIAQRRRWLKIPAFGKRPGKI